MANLLVVTGSVRPDSANSKIVPVVADIARGKDHEVTIADLGALNLPFFDAPLPPSAPEFEAPHENVREWTKLVADADGVVFVTPEYNHTLSALQLNAIDWIGKEWAGKPIALVGYGWTSGGGQAHATAREALAVNLKATISDVQANLFFTKELNPDGSIADAAAVEQKVGASIDDLAQIIG